MSLRRSARVQASSIAPKAIKETSLKRAFASTKPLSVKKTEKNLETEESAKENVPAAKLSQAANTPKKRRKVEVKESAKSLSVADTVPVPTEVAQNVINSGLPSPIATRPVKPHVTNAPLLSPTDGYVVTAYESGLAAEVPPPTSTTSSVLEEAIAHLVKVDTTNRLKRVIEGHPCGVFSPASLAEPIDPFSSLSSGIISQQVSGAAAKSIKNKFIALFPATAPAFPPPAVVAATPIPTLRSAGLSQRKAEYIQGLAERFVSGELSAEILATASDEEVMERLVAVRGLGKWSVEMFSFFEMKRMDVFSTGDLGIQRGMAAYVGRDVSKLKAKGGGKWKYMSEKDMLDISAKFSPYRSLFMWYMWRMADVNVDAIQDA